MQNKLMIITDQVFAQLFALLDPNNYFFAFHPRELRVNQSLIKLPFASLPLLLFALYHLPSHPFKKTIVPLTLSSVLGLSFLSNFDRHDLILYPLLISLTVFGARQFQRRFPRLYIPYLFIFFLFTIIEFIRLIIPHV